MINKKTGGYIAIAQATSLFSKTKSYPSEILCNEVVKAGCYVFEEGTAEISFEVLLDVPQTALMPPLDTNLPTFAVEVEISKSQLLDCIAHANVFDVKNEMVVWENDGKDYLLDVSEDCVRQVISDEGRAIVLSYILLFGSAAIEQARAEYLAESEGKNFKPAIEAMLNETGLAIAA